MKTTEVNINERKITMVDIMKGLGIEIGDIVKVGSAILICNQFYDLVNFYDGKYSVNYPNLILGMVSGKQEYTVHKCSEMVVHKVLCN